jgi:hypothetical protein
LDFNFWRQKVFYDILNMTQEQKYKYWLKNCKNHQLEIITIIIKDKIIELYNVQSVIEIASLCDVDILIYILKKLNISQVLEIDTNSSPLTLCNCPIVDFMIWNFYLKNRNYDSDSLDLLCQYFGNIVQFQVDIPELFKKPALKIIAQRKRT